MLDLKKPPEAVRAHERLSLRNPFPRGSLAGSWWAADLGLLQGCHPAAEHGAAVPADVQEELSVVAGAPVLMRLHYQGQRGTINN